MRRLLWFTIGFTAGTALLVYTMAGICWLLAPVAAALAAVCFFLPKKWGRRPAAALLGLAVGTLYCSGYTAMTAPPPSVDGGTQSFSAVALTEPLPSRYGQRVEARVTLPEGEWRAMLYYSDADAPVRPGDALSGRAKFTVTATRTEDADDLYFSAEGVRLTGSVRDILAVSPRNRVPLPQSAARFSATVKEKLARAFPASSAGYFTALVTGDRSGMDYAFLNRMSICGLYHAVSLSGMHVSVLMGILLFLCGRRKKLAALVGVPVLVLFVLFSGVRPSTVRAVTMCAALLFASFARREYDPLTALAAALLLLLAQNPWCIAQWGLQLSFWSTAGILVLFPVMQKRIRLRRLKQAFVRKTAQAVLGVVEVSLSATAFSLPLMTAYFGIVSLIAPVTNLLALWSVMASFVGGIVTALLALLSPGIAGAAGSVLHLLYRYLEVVLSLFSGLPLAAVYESQPILLAWSFLWYGLLAAWLLFRPRWFVPLLCAAVSFAAALGITALQTQRDGFTVLDVGQGQSILCARGETAYLLDCGGIPDESGETAARSLLAYGRTRLDAVVLTHFDDDHCNGLGQLLDRVDAAALYYPARAEDTQTRTAALEAAAAHGLALYPVSESVTLPLSGGRVTLYPAPGGENDNDSGLCILASAAECDILVTGDLSRSGEQRLVNRYDLPDLEGLVAGHHGAGGSTGRVLLEILRPETVLISTGENAYGHPAPEVLERIRAAGAAAYTTLENGNLTIGW